MNLIITWESGPAVCSICGKIPCKHFKIIESQDVNAMQSFNEFGTSLYHEEFGPEQVKHEHEMKLKQTKEEYERHHGRL